MLHEQVTQTLLQLLHSTPPSADSLLAALRLLAKHRSLLLQNTLIQLCGSRVLSGPFEGMAFLPTSAEGCHVPKLLGCYEAELHPAMETVVRGGCEVILNVGCAEGYYAVGLARRLPGCKVLAFDSNPASQASCRQLATLNGVLDRIEVGGLFQGQQFADYASKATLVLCDVEGAEGELLDPVAFPALRGMDVIVECHDCFRPGLSEELQRRFAGSHVIERFQQTLRAVSLPPFFAQLGHLDQLLAVWEWRSGPTPWLVMRRSGFPA